MTTGELTMNWITGAVGVIIILSTSLGLYIQTRTIGKQRKDESEKALKAQSEKAEKDLAQAVLEARKETSSEIAFRDLKQSVDGMVLTVKCIESNMNNRVDGVEKRLNDHVEKLAEVRSSASSAHKRLDEHRAVEHGVNGNHYPAQTPEVK